MIIVLNFGDAVLILLVQSDSSLIYDLLCIYINNYSNIAYTVHRVERYRPTVIPAHLQFEINVAVARLT